MRKLLDFIYDEINFKEILRNPKRWVGYSFIIIFLAIFVVSLSFLDQIDKLYRNATPYDEPDPQKLFKDVELSLGKKIEGVKIEEIKSPTNEMLARAREIYTTTCASCHGPNGNGDGIAGKGLNPPPRDFASITGWKIGRGIVQIYKTLQEGIPGTAMVSYDYLSPKEKIALFYVINGFSNDVPEVTAKDIQELDETYKVTQNLDVPPTIPIAKAISKISNENKNYLDKIQKISHALNDEYLDKYISDKRSFANFILRASNFQQNYLDLLLESFPLNGVSPKFIKASKQEKEKFFDRLTSLIKMD